MLMDLLEKFFNENPWYDMTNLDELIIQTSLDEMNIRVIIKKKVFFFNIQKKKHDLNIFNNNNNNNNIQLCSATLKPNDSNGTEKTLAYS
jgi:hypothetical protein